jgi:hypothetical protein
MRYDADMGVVSGALSLALSLAPLFSPLLVSVYVCVQCADISSPLLCSGAAQEAHARDKS